MSLTNGFDRIKRVLIANRGEIACRVIRSCKELGLTSIAIYTPADRSSLHVRFADEVYLLNGPDQSAYTDEDEVLRVARESGAHALVPGYGFLSENDGFAERVEAAGLTWVGPTSRVIRQFGLKHTARELAVQAGVPVIQGTDLLKSPEDAMMAAERIGYPIMLKATAGGGGMGLQICNSPSEITAAFESVTARSASLFSTSSMFMERYIPRSRHVEVQVFGNGLGQAVHFNERECSIQRRHQKVVEECPSPFVHRRQGMRKRLTDCAVSLASAVAYGSAGTVEFLVDDQSGDFFFLEMNTRLQVEHGITEMCHDVDLVSLMLQQAEMQARGDGGLPYDALRAVQKDAPKGFAIEARVYAEIPSRNFAPSPGLLQHVEWHQEQGVRIDTWIASGTNISPFYDPMIAKVMAWAESHEEATRKIAMALNESKVQGCPNNIQYLSAIIGSTAFAEGDTTTAFLTSDSFKFTPATFDIVSGGAYTTIQDLPARRGVGNGVPEAGPMDPVSFRVANLLAGNNQNTEALEMTLIGPELLFHTAAVIAVTGGTVDVYVDGVKVDMYTRLVVPAGKKLKLGSVTSGCRSYIAVQGGFPAIPVYLGSKSTTSTLGLGGYQGRQLLPGDSIDLDPRSNEWAEDRMSLTLPVASRLDRLWTNKWTIHIMPGPHDDPEFLTEDDRTILYEDEWRLKPNSTRSGYQLQGGCLRWAREDGGEGGSHPGNVIDEPYSFGGMNFNGDNPVLLVNDSPMAGGLASTSTIPRSEAWRLGQCRPGDSLKLKRISWASALEMRQRTEKYIDQVRRYIARECSAEDVRAPDPELVGEVTDTILHTIPADQGNNTVEVKFRQAGDSYIHVTYGPMTADVRVRAHIQLRLNRLNAGEVPGVVAVIGCTRSFCVQFDSVETSQEQMLQSLIRLEKSLSSSNEAIPSRIFQFPVLLEDPISKQAVKDYMETARSSAVYLPDNMEYIARANGIDSREKASRSLVACPQLVTEVSFLCGTPLMVPLDPRLVYVAQKYNPVRSFTPEGTVGLGGPLYVIYPMAAPGGYQLCARTLSTWDAYASKPGFDQPWLMREFDQIQFYEVDQAGFDKCYEDFKTGRYHFEVRETTFDPAEHKKFLASIADEAAAFKTKRDAATKDVGAEERKLLAAWKEQTQKEAEEQADGEAGGDDLVSILAPMTANVWKVQVSIGDKLEEGQVVAILEAMKMEIPVRADASVAGGTVSKILGKPGSLVDPGATILAVKM